MMEQIPNLEIFFSEGPGSLGHVQERPSILPFDDSLFRQFRCASNGQPGQSKSVSEQHEIGERSKVMGERAAPDIGERVIE